MTGIEVHPQTATWATLDTQLCEIVDCGAHPLFSEEVKAPSDVLLKMVRQLHTFFLVCNYQLPKSVLEPLL